MKFSVLIPIYEKENPEYLRQCLNSIINQTIKPSQIIIFKDGPITKGLEDVLNSYKENIEIYGYEEKQGVGQALKEGIKYCKYEYIARMDADDIAMPERFEVQLKILEKNPKIDILGGYIEEYDEQMKKKFAIRKVPLYMEEIQKCIKMQSPFNHGTVIMKKDKLLEVGNYKNVPLEDYELWARMYLNGCYMQNTNKILVKFRTSNSMYKRRSGVNYIKKIIYIEKELLKNGVINRREYKRNIFYRTILAMLPICIKKYIYIHIIRRKIK